MGPSVYPSRVIFVKYSIQRHVIEVNGNQENKPVEFDQFRKVVRVFSAHITQLLGISQ